ncbi:MAG: HlyD family efflux transporter periplasmic adaptor subunit [Hahellaceae bacterium]|nr:HlyD family efflux transporter periplasmic adaptor subunit [Hahellaceae bacterium]
MRVFCVWLCFLLTACQDEAPRIYGTVERDRLTLTAPVGELIAATYVTEGQRVQAGDLLLELDATAAQARVAQRQGELIRASAQLEEITKGARDEELARAQALLTSTQATLEEAANRYERVLRLFNTKVLTEADLDSARAVKITAQAARDRASESLRELVNGARGEQVTQAKAAVDIANAQLTLEQKGLSDLQLRAARAAVVDNLPWHTGDRVTAGTQLISLLMVEKPYVRVYLPSRYLTQVKAGSVLDIWVDGQSIAIPGRVRAIRSQPAYTPYYALNERDRSRLMYLCDIELPESSELPTGLAVEVGMPK